MILSRSASVPAKTRHTQAAFAGILRERLANSDWLTAEKSRFLDFAEATGGNDYLHVADHESAEELAAKAAIACASSDIDAIITATSTRFISPGLSSHLCSRLKCRGNTQLYDLTGMGCSASLASWQLAEQIIKSGARSVLCVSVEIHSALRREGPHIPLQEFCRYPAFSDGAGAALFTSWGAGPRINDFDRYCLFDPESSFSLTEAACKYDENYADVFVGDVVACLTPDERTLLLYPGGKKSLQMLKERGIKPAQSVEDELRLTGNTGSAFLYGVLQREDLTKPCLLAASSNSRNFISCSLN